MSATSGKTFYLSAVSVNTSGPGITYTPLLLAKADQLGGQAKTVFINIIPGDIPLADYAIVAVADRPEGNDPATSLPYEPVAGFYQQFGPVDYLTDNFAALQALITTLHGQTVADLLTDQDVGGYGEG